MSHKVSYGGGANWREGVAINCSKIIITNWIVSEVVRSTSYKQATSQPPWHDSRLIIKFLLFATVQTAKKPTDDTAYILEIANFSKTRLGYGTT